MAMSAWVAPRFAHCCPTSSVVPTTGIPCMIVPILVASSSRKPTATMPMSGRATISLATRTPARPAPMSIVRTALAASPRARWCDFLALGDRLLSQDAHAHGPPRRRNESTAKLRMMPMGMIGRGEPTGTAFGQAAARESRRRVASSTSGGGERDHRADAADVRQPNVSPGHSVHAEGQHEAVLKRDDVRHRRREGAHHHDGHVSLEAEQVARHVGDARAHDRSMRCCVVRWANRLHHDFIILGAPSAFSLPQRSLHAARPPFSIEEPEMARLAGWNRGASRPGVYSFSTPSIAASRCSAASRCQRAASGCLRASISKSAADSA